MPDLPLMEPIVLVDKPHNQEAHIIVNTHQTFDDMLDTARRINTNLFAGDWDLSYFDTETKESKPVQSTDTIGDYLNKNINTFYWSYKPVRFKIPLDNRPKTPLNRPAPAQSGYYGPGESAPSYRLMQYGNFGKRIGAYFLDYTFIFFVIGILSENTLLFGEDSPLPIAVIWLYFAGMESSKFQGTLGKLAVGLKVTDLNGNGISFLRASARYFCGMLSWATAMVGFVIAAITNKKQALHDLLAGTLVLERAPMNQTNKVTVIR